MSTEIPERTVGKNQSDIEPDQRSAAPEYKTHEPTDRIIFLHPVSIVDPDEREVLSVVENFEQGDASENIGDAVVTVPPKPDAGGEKRQFYRISALSLDPHPREIRDGQNGDGDGERQDPALQPEYGPSRNRRYSAGIKHVQRIRHPRGRKQNRRGKPNRTGGQVQPPAQGRERTH